MTTETDACEAGASFFATAVGAAVDWSSAVGVLSAHAAARATNASGSVKVLRIEVSGREARGWNRAPILARSNKLRQTLP
jgi:hypothetical protein